MKQFLYSSLFLMCFLAIIKQVNAVELYKSYDKNGNKVYSDIPPKNTDYQKQVTAPIKTVNWVKTKTIKLRSVKRKSKRYKPTPLQNKKAICEKLKRNTRLVESKLRQRNRIKQFDQLAEQLSKYRWQYHMSC